MARLAATIGVVAVLVASRGDAVHAAPEAGQAFKDWLVACEPLPGSEEKRCYITQNITLRESGQRLLHVAVGYIAQDDRAAAIVTLPLGIFLPPGVSISIDGGEPSRFAVHYCVQAGCRAVLGLDQDLIGRLKAGRQARLTFQDPNRREIGVPISLLGFTAGLDSLQP